MNEFSLMLERERERASLTGLTIKKIRNENWQNAIAWMGSGLVFYVNLQWLSSVFKDGLLNQSLRFISRCWCHIHELKTKIICIQFPLWIIVNTETTPSGIYCCNIGRVWIFPPFPLLSLTYETSRKNAFAIKS